MKGDLDDVLWLESSTTNRATPVEHSFVMFVCADVFWYVKCLSVQYVYYHDLTENDHHLSDKSTDILEDYILESSICGLFFQISQSAFWFPLRLKAVYL